MLELRFTVQNPTSRVFNYTYSYIKFTAVDSGGVPRNTSATLLVKLPIKPARFRSTPDRRSMFTRPFAWRRLVLCPSSSCVRL
jgi:hypothetical protein